MLHAIVQQLRIVSTPWWIVIGAVTALLLIFRHKREQLIGDLLIVYIITILASTVLSRPPSLEFIVSERINLNLIDTWIERITGDSGDRSELLLNFCMLLPVGILFPWATKKGFLPTALTGFALTVLIEAAQFLTKRGWFELTDIVDNTAGVMIGYALYRIGAAVWRKTEC